MRLLAPLHLIVLVSALTSGCGGGHGSSGTAQPVGSAPLRPPTQQIGPDQPRPSVGGAQADAIDLGPFWSFASAQIASVATFDVPGADSVANWTFYNGAEFPGASGSLASIATNWGAGAGLAYDLSCNGYTWQPIGNKSCGRYVSMQLPVANAAPAIADETPTLAIDVRNLQATAFPGLRIIDNTGQTLQFKLNARSLENWDGAKWQTTLTTIGSSTRYWGGASDGTLHPPIRSISILAGDVPLPAPAGVVEVDNIKYLANPATAFALKANAPLVDRPYPSSYVGRLGVVWRPRFGYAALDKMLEVGLNLVRFDITWAAVERNGQYDFSYYTTAADEMAKRHVKGLFLLVYGHPDHGGATPVTDLDRAAYAAYARQAALTFGPKNVLAGFEIWNEPNLAGFWPGQDPALYGQALASAITAIRSVDPSIPIVTGGVASTDFNYLSRVLRSGYANGASAIGVHPYRQSGPETFAAELSPLMQLARSASLDLPWWDTEWGYSSYIDVGSTAAVGDGHDPRALRRQGVLVLRKMLTAIALNLPRSILYEAMDEGTNPVNREHNFGLLNHDLSDKPAMTGARRLFAAQNGRTLRGLLSETPPGIHVLRWDGTTDRVFAIWNDSPGTPTTVTLPTNTIMVTLWDGTQARIASGTNEVVLTEADGPIFVTLGAN